MPDAKLDVSHPTFTATQSARKILRAPIVEEITGRSRTSLWRDVRANRFPAPVKIGPNSIGWWEDEVQAHQSGLQRVGYAPAPVESHKSAESAQDGSRIGNAGQKRRSSTKGLKPIGVIAAQIVSRAGSRRGRP